MAKSKDEALKKTTQAVKKSSGDEERGVSERIKQWFSDLKSELKKVVWPTRQQTVKNTTVALALTFAAAVVLWVFDSLADAGVSALIRLTVG